MSTEIDLTTITLKDTIKYMSTYDKLENKGNKDDITIEFMKKQPYYGYTYNYIFNYKSELANVNKQKEQLELFFDENFRLSQNNLNLQKKYYKLIKEIGENHTLSDNKKFVMISINKILITNKEKYFLFFVNNNTELLTKIRDNYTNEQKNNIILDNTIWCDIALSVILNIFQKNIFTFLINILENDKYLRFIIDFLNLIREIVITINNSYAFNLVEDNKARLQLYINNAIILKDKFKVDLNIYSNIDISKYYYTKLPKTNEINDEIIFQITDKFVNYLNGNLYNSIDDLTKEINDFYNNNYYKKNKQPIEQVVQNPIEQPVQQPQSVQKKSFMNRLKNGVSKVALKFASNIPSIPSFNWKKSKTGGESKQSREIIKTKERVVVRYENVKYKRNVLIKNNKRYVKINKRLVSI